MPDDTDAQTQDPTPQPSPAPDDRNSTPSTGQADPNQPTVRRAIPFDPQHDYDDALQQGMKLRTEWLQADERYRKEAEWGQKQAEKVLNEPMPPMPSFDQAYPQPKPMPAQNDQKDRSKTILSFMAVAIPLAIALGGRRRGSAIGALAGLSQGIQAINEGYDDKAKHAAALWKQQNDAAAKYGKDQMDYYKDIIANRKTSIEEKMQLINHTAEAFKDEAMVKKSEVDDWNGVVESLAKRQQLYDDHLKNRIDTEEKIMKHLGSGEVYEDYKQHLMQKSPDFRKAAESGDSGAYFREYNKAVEKYTWKDFLDEKEKMKVQEAKDKKKAESDLDDGADSSTAPEDTKNLDSMANDLAKKLRGGQ
jgi:hypothetical protein